MRIKEIKITGLFEMFDHNIILNSEEHLTIIYGINGIGKTMLFKILDSFFKGEFDVLVNYPFKQLQIIYDNNNYFTTSIDEEFLNIKYITANENFEYKIQKKKATEFYDLLIEEEKKIDIPGIITLEPNEFSDNVEFSDFKSGIEYSIDEIIEKYKENLSENFLALYQFLTIFLKTKIYFIETQRLFTFNYEDSVQTETVKIYSEKLSKLIQLFHNKYSELSKELEFSLGKRLINKQVQPFSNYIELKEEYEKLEEKRNKLKSVGLFEDLKYEQFDIPKEIDETTRAILSVNIKDMKEKLKIFDELYGKLSIFLDILNNKRFSYKKISVHPQKGFVFTNNKGKELKVTELSSGEQHEIVLFYELLFEVPENSLVLIDEPEISLHIAWQKEFLDDMTDIVKIRNFDILIATHSPSIIDDNWHLTVELEKN